MSNVTSIKPKRDAAFYVKHGTEDQVIRLVEALEDQVSAYKKYKEAAEDHIISLENLIKAQDRIITISYMGITGLALLLLCGAWFDVWG